MDADLEIRELLAQRVRELPAQSLREVETFLDYLRYKEEQQETDGAVPLAGVLSGYRFTEQTIADARKEIWGDMDNLAR